MSEGEELGVREGVANYKTYKSELSPLFRVKFLQMLPPKL